MNVLNILLVDDEDFVLEGLRDAVDWNHYGMNIIGYANNGKEAIDILTTSIAQVDIVITDIKMPIMDGFGLIEAIKSLNYPCKIVVLTGHDEFQFAKTAITYGVFEYLLKPVELDSITKVLEQLTRAIVDEKEKITATAQVEKKLKESLPLMQDQLLYSLLNGSYEPELMEFIGVPMNAACYQTLIGYVWPALITAPDMHIIREEVCNAVEICGDPVGFLYNTRGIIVIMSFSETNAIYQLESVLNEVSHQIQIKHHISVKFALGKMCTVAYQIPKSFLEAREAMRLNLLSVNTPTDEWEEPLENNQTLFPPKERQRLFNALSARNIESVEHYLDQLQSKYEKSQTLYPAGYLHKLSNELIMLLSVIQYEHNRTDEFWETSYTETIQKIQKSRHSEDVFPQIKSLYKQIAGSLTGSADKKNRQAIRMCLDYIDKNLDSEIRLEELAHMVFLTPNYLGAIFKERVGISFSEYLTQERMEKAKKLLSIPGNRVYEVSQQVGYKSAHYFSKLFKEYTGVKPSQFK
ncbi:response regulator [Paenibacillus tundrae]|uniref:response regulator n=1 Tax=Paenibacillus tundrae TaxID=528187 RepID=UPI0030CC4A50